MGIGSIWPWVIVLIIVLLVFGTKKLQNIGSDLGGAIKGFKEGMKSSEKEEAEQDQAKQMVIDDKGHSSKEEDVKNPTSSNHTNS